MINRASLLNRAAVHSRLARVGQRVLPPKPSVGRRVFGVILVAFAAALAIVSGYTAYEVTMDLRTVRSEASDNVEWSLAQTELETRDFTAALEAAMLRPDENLERLRLRYDILFSRVDTLVQSPVYQRLNTSAEFDAAVQELSTFTKATEHIIDAPDEVLIAALPQLMELTHPLRRATRTLSLQGLTFFARQADLHRAQINDSWVRLTTSIVALITALVALVFHIFYLYRRTRRHGLALAQSNSRMNTILTASIDGVLVVDGKGRILEFNQACEDMFGLRFEDIQGQDFLPLIVPPHQRAMHASAMQRILNHQGGHIAGSGRVRFEGMRADGSHFPAEVSVEIAVEENQTIFIGFIHDISDRVAAEEELLETRDRALAGERAKAEFITVMSHEIRTPLNGILGNLNLLNDTALTRTQNRYLRNMKISGRVLMRHVDAVLNLARFDSGSVPTTLKELDLSLLMQDLVDSQLSTAAARDTALSWRWEGTPQPWVRTDAGVLEQILLNLIGNAIKFTAQGAVEIALEALPSANPEITLIEIRVADNGVGISAERLPHVFDDFVTSDASLSRVPGGIGLGLGIAKRLATSLGGHIGVDSTLGSGSTFWVRLPMPTGARPAPPSNPQESVPLKALRILLVEDNAINRELAREILLRGGHSVTSARDGQEGLQVAASTRFDVILMDIAMPIMDGLQTTKAIRATSGPNQRTPIIALSANVLPDERARLSAADMDGFLGKPLERDALDRQLANLPIVLDTPDVDASADTPEKNAAINASTRDTNAADLPAATYHRLLARFLSEGDILADAVRANTAPQDLAQGCHDLAGASALFGADALQALLSQADTAAKKNDSAAFERAIAQIPALWHQTRVSLEKDLPRDVAE